MQRELAAVLGRALRGRRPGGSTRAAVGERGRPLCQEREHSCHDACAVIVAAAGKGAEARRGIAPSCCCGCCWAHWAPGSRAMLWGSRHVLPHALGRRHAAAMGRVTDVLAHCESAPCWDKTTCEVLMRARVWRAQGPDIQSADGAAGRLLQRLQQHDGAVSALSLLPRSRVSLLCVCLGRLDDAREPGGMTTAVRLSAGVARLCFEDEAVGLDVWGTHWEDVVMNMLARVWRAQVPVRQSADDAAGGLLQRLQQHDGAVSALSLLPRFRFSTPVCVRVSRTAGRCARAWRCDHGNAVVRWCGTAVL